MKPYWFPWEYPGIVEQILLFLHYDSYKAAPQQTKGFSSEVVLLF